MIHYARRARRGRPAMKITDRGIEGGPYEGAPADDYYATFAPAPLWTPTLAEVVAEFKARRYPPDIRKERE